MANLQLIKFNNLSTEVEEYYLDKSKLIKGNPLQSLWNHYTDPSGKFFSGIWQSEVGKWTINYTEEEFCHMLEGVSIVTNEEGLAVTLRAGDSFVIPRGFKGSWEVVETSKKEYAIYEK